MKRWMGAGVAGMLAWVGLLGGVVRAGELADGYFQLRFDGDGVRGLRRVGDVADTDYVANGAAFGRVLVRYRTAANGDWRELREVVLGEQEAGRSVSYQLGSRARPLAARSSVSAPLGASGVRALADGLVPGKPVRGVAAAEVPVFTLSGEHGTRQWAQYTFPEAAEVAAAELFWVHPPKSWRLVYAQGGEWKEVRAHGGYPLAAGEMVRVEFDPVVTRVMRVEVELEADGMASLAEWRVGGEPPVVAPADLQVTSKFSLAGGALDWTVSLRNPGPRPVEVGDLAMPVPFAEKVGARGDIYTKKLLRHWLIAGHGSFAYWHRSNAVGPFLVMAPQGEAKFEYYDDSGGGAGAPAFTPYVHAMAAATAARAGGGNWRLPVTKLTIPAGEERSYTLRFCWAGDFAGVRQSLYELGKADVVVAPGMVVPSDLGAQVAMRSKVPVRALVAEHPGQTRIETGQPANGDASTQVFRLEFSRLGENLVRVEYADGRWSTLEFFVTEPLETVIKKRAAFLAGPQQHKDASKWYCGAYGDWDQKNEVLRGPEDRDGLSTWLTDSNDDAGNARPAFLAGKNVHFPVRAEIESLELYISKYLWGGMQMTEAEKYPYAIYGIPNFKENRESPDPGRNGRAHVWRIYDYPHIALLYYRMFQIARFYPEMVRHLDAATYLERAFRTAVAYWTVPLEVEGWSANAVPTMNEAFIPELIDTLEREGKAEWAATLRGHWEGKVRRFVMDPPNLFGSEFAFDSTGFESTGAFANYAMTTARDDFRANVPLERAREFRDFQLRLNIGDRGWVETSYYQLGSDYRNGLSYLLSYMSQLGGGALLEHGLRHADEPTDFLRLGYASILSSWALVNSGTAQSGFGHWFPSAANDGACGGGFMPEPFGRTWIGKSIGRGAWYYSAEADVGFAGVLRHHATVVANDPVFGEIAYGGELARRGDTLEVIPRDGLRARLHVVRPGQRFHLELERDGFAAGLPVRVSDALDHGHFTIENRSGTGHATEVSLTGLPAGDYQISVDGQPPARLSSTGAPLRVSVRLEAGRPAQVRWEKR